MEHGAMTAQKTIGVAASAVGGPFAVGICQGIERVLRAHGYAQFVLQGTPAVLGPQQLGQAQACGWIASFDAEGFTSLTQGELPGVSVCAVDHERRYPSVRSDNTGATRELTLHLIDHGHTRFAFFTVSRNLDFIERFEGFQQALRERGLEFDPQLFLESRYYDVPGAQGEMERHLARGLSCTALVAASDELAIAAVRAIGAAGLSVPDDIAIVGFDDISDAQSITPPLTTVRQTPTLLGAAAAQILVDILAGKPPEQKDVRIPAQIIVRQSCGCRALAVDAVEVAGIREGDWRAALARQLVNIMRAPLELRDDELPETYWPEVAQLVAALGGGVPAELGALHDIWLSAIRHNDRVATLEALYQALDQAGRRLAAEGGVAEPEEFLEQSRVALHSARVSSQQRRQESMERLARASNALTRVLLNRQEAGNALDWLRSTTIPFACIATWSGEAGAPRLTIEQIFSRGLQSPVMIGQSFPAEEFPSQALIAMCQQAGESGYATTVPIHTPNRSWGILLLSGLHAEPFAGRIDPQDIWSNTLALMFERRDVEQALQAEREELRLAYDRERALAETVRELGCPVLPVLPGVLLVPLIGSIDTQRAQLIIELVLRGVETYRATRVMLDVTGVPLVDTQVAASLLQTASAATLLGARVSLVGVRPEIAQSIVGLGISLHGLATYPTLAAALQGFERRV
jgi:DNA-binding LacI/PurR family transcriptional regulator/anti-anti-sigma regulatory factor